jgi:hypothetical protein
MTSPSNTLAWQAPLAKFLRREKPTERQSGEAGDLSADELQTMLPRLASADRDERFSVRQRVKRHFWRQSPYCGDCGRYLPHCKNVVLVDAGKIVCLDCNLAEALQAKRNRQEERQLRHQALEQFRQCATACEDCGGAVGQHPRPREEWPRLVWRNGRPVVICLGCLEVSAVRSSVLPIISTPEAVPVALALSAMAAKPLLVKLCRRAGRPFILAHWLDPVTGAERLRSTGTIDRAEAERFAADLEAELQAGGNGDSMLAPASRPCPDPPAPRRRSFKHVTWSEAALLATEEPQPIPYLPSEEEIAAQCAAIRVDWSEREHRMRAGQSEGVPAPWSVPVRRGARIS